MSITVENVTFTKSGKHLNFDISNIDVGFLNSIRRVILSEIPNIAVNFESYNIFNNDITFHKNTSVLHNEFTGHRISLIPLCFEETEILSFDPNDYKFRINEKGKKLVTTKDIKIYDANDNLYPPDVHSKIFPPDPITNDYIIITKLKNEDEVLDVTFRARIGIAKTHSRWSPVSTCTFFNNLDNKLVEEERPKATDSNKFDTIDKYRLFLKNEYGEPNSFNFTIESECRMTPVYIFESAIKILHSKVGSCFNNPTIELIDHDSHMYAITISGENHTIGNLLQVSIFNIYVRNENKVDYIGYIQPHPLEEKIVFKIRFYNEMTDDGITEFLNDVVKNTQKILSDIPIPTTTKPNPTIQDATKKKTRTKK